jgi:antibiotic biosynthesis monooxygenase (ABM) superfamily enzyme
MALLAWPIAFGLVLTLLTVFKQQLASMALAPRALAISAVLVSVMAIVVMPLLTVAVSRALAEDNGAESGSSPVCAPRGGPTVGV